MPGHRCTRTINRNDGKNFRSRYVRKRSRRMAIDGLAFSSAAQHSDQKWWSMFTHSGTIYVIIQCHLIFVNVRECVNTDRLNKSSIVASITIPRWSDNKPTYLFRSTTLSIFQASCGKSIRKISSHFEGEHEASHSSDLANSDKTIQRMLTKSYPSRVIPFSHTSSIYSDRTTDTGIVMYPDQRTAAFAKHFIKYSSHRTGEFSKNIADYVISVVYTYFHFGQNFLSKRVLRLVINLIYRNEIITDGRKIFECCFLSTKFSFPFIFNLKSHAMTKSLGFRYAEVIYVLRMYY